MFTFYWNVQKLFILKSTSKEKRKREVKYDNLQTKNSLAKEYPNNAQILNVYTGTNIAFLNKINSNCFFRWTPWTKIAVSL